MSGRRNYMKTPIERVLTTMQRIIQGKRYKNVA